MFINPGGTLGLLFLLPLAAAVPNPTPAPDFSLGSLNLYNRAIPGVSDPITGTTSSSSSSAPGSTTTPPVSSPPADVTTTTSTTSSSSSSSSTSSRTTSTTPPAPASTVSESLTTSDGVILTMTVVVSAQTPSAPTVTPPDTQSSGGTGTGTYIGLGVAGGIAVLGLIAFIVWKFNQKRFSQLDDDAGDINWPMPKEAVLQAPVAPSMAATNVTNSSVDLSHDPYAVPPLPPARAVPYYDDPSGSGVFYDPYRGPVPQTFNTPPASTEGHAAAYPGEAIPMSTYASNNGRQSPGPNDPYARSGSPGPAMAYGDPYARTRSPGPAVAYEDPYAGRRSPGPSLAYGAPGPYDPMARVGTPVRGGTPVGHAGAPPALDIIRTGTPGSHRGPSPAPPGAQPYGIQHQPGMQDPYGGYGPGAYGR